MRSLVRDGILGAFLLGALALPGGARADTVTIYRCVDAKASVTLQDAPCPRDAHQDVRQMIRPQDPSPQTIAVGRAYTAAPRMPDVRPNRNRQPRPLYECRSPEGQTYTSQDGVPRSRYVPVWTTSYGGLVNPGRPQQRPGVYAAMTYEQDTCELLPPDETCQRLRDQRDEIDTRAFNAQPDERMHLERERKTLSDQLRNECP